MYELPTATCHVNYWLMPVTPKKVITADRVIRATCLALDVSERLLIGKGRIKKIVRARFICMYVMKNHIKKISLKSIGELFGGRDHTTVIHAIRTIEDDLTVTAYRAETNQLISAVIELL